MEVRQLRCPHHRPRLARDLHNLPEVPAAAGADGEQERQREQEGRRRPPAAGAWVEGLGSRIELEALLEMKLIRIASPWRRRSGLGILGNNETFLKFNYSDSKIQLIPTSTNMTDSPILRACMNLNPCTKFNQF